MNETQFRRFVAAAILGSGRIRRESFNTYEIGKLLRYSVGVAKKAWQFQDSDDPFLLFAYASLLGSKGCLMTLRMEDYSFYWDEAKRLCRTAKGLESEWLPQD